MPKKGTTKYLSDRQEKEVAEEINGKQVIASGALWSMKADVRNDRLLVECKITEKEYYRLTLATWKKIEEQAVRDSIRYPLMCIDVKVKGEFYRYAVFDPYEIGYTRDFPPEEGILRKQISNLAKSVVVPNKDNEKCLYYNSFNALLVLPWEDFKDFASKKGLI